MNIFDKMVKIMCVCVFAVMLLIMADRVFAGDTELYTLINGKSYEMTVGSVDYTFDFYGIDAEKRIGTCYLIWNDYIILDGHEYPIFRYVVFQYLVSGNVIRIPIADANGTVTVFCFIPDYEGAIRQIAPDFRFFPAAE